MLKLVKLSNNFKTQLYEMMDEWTNCKETIIPGAINKIDYHYFDIYLNELDNKEDSVFKVPSSVYFLYDTKIDKFLGAVDIRHHLNKDLLLYGGHIGDGIRPSFRNKGLGTQLVKLSLEKCLELGIKDVLMTCFKTNIASAKTIVNNGGILENEISDNNGNVIQRYWINL